MKNCLNCSKELILPPGAHGYLKSNFRLKKFCDDRCRIEFNNKSKKNSYVLKETEHNNKLKDLNLFIKGQIGTVKGIKNHYNPDVVLENKDYELEIFRNMTHLKKKVKNWNPTRKHILVLAISEQTKELFDEVYLFNGKSLIKEK